MLDRWVTLCLSSVRIMTDCTSWRSLGWLNIVYLRTCSAFQWDQDLVTNCCFCDCVILESLEIKLDSSTINRKTCLNLTIAWDPVLTLLPTWLAHCSVNCSFLLTILGVCVCSYMYSILPYLSHFSCVWFYDSVRSDEDGQTGCQKLSSW